MESVTNIEAEVEQNYKHNFIVNIIDSTAFWFGASFFAYRTVLPIFLANLTDSEFAIGLLSTIIATGWLLPQLFTAQWTQRLKLKKYAPVTVGFFSERVPIFLLPAAAWLATISTQWAVVAFFVLVTWHLVGAGIIAVGWQDMIAKIFPVDRRGKFFGLANFGGTFTGIAGASTAAWLLGRYEFPHGYIYSFAIGAVMILVSWFFLAQTKEPLTESKDEAESQVDFLRKLPKILKSETNYRRYISSQIVTTIGGIALGFLAVYAVQRWNLSDSYAGYFTTSMLLGQAFSNLVFGWMADNKGHKLVLEISILASVVSVALAFFAPQPTWFYAVFALTGVSAAGFMLSGIMIVFEFTTPDQRPTLIGMNNTIIGVFSAVTPMLGAWIIKAVNYQMLFAVAAIFNVIGLLMMRFWVQEPRKANAGNVE